MRDDAHRQAIRSPQNSGYARPVGAAQSTNLADLLERVLDKGIVIAGDITLSLGTVELLTLKIRLLIASVDKAQEMGINWWQFDPALSSQARAFEEERAQLKERVERQARALEEETAVLKGRVERQAKALEEERAQLKERFDRLESRLAAQTGEAEQKQSE